MTKVSRKLKGLALYLSELCLLAKLVFSAAAFSLKKLGFRRELRSDLISADFSGMIVRFFYSVYKTSLYAL